MLSSILKLCTDMEHVPCPCTFHAYSLSPAQSFCTPICAPENCVMPSICFFKKSTQSSVKRNGNRGRENANRKNWGREGGA